MRLHHCSGMCGWVWSLVTMVMCPFSEEQAKILRSVSSSIEQKNEELRFALLIIHVHVIIISLF